MEERDSGEGLGKFKVGDDEFEAILGPHGERIVLGSDGREMALGPFGEWIPRDEYEAACKAASEGGYCI